MLAEEDAEEFAGLEALVEEAIAPARRAHRVPVHPGPWIGCSGDANAAGIMLGEQCAAMLLASH